MTATAVAVRLAGVPWRLFNVGLDDTKEYRAKTGRPIMIVREGR